jgi:hypothetical protein
MGDVLLHRALHPRRQTRRRSGVAELVKLLVMSSSSSAINMRACTLPQRREREVHAAAQHHHDARTMAAAVQPHSAPGVVSGRHCAVLHDVLGGCIVGRQRPLGLVFPA